MKKTLTWQIKNQSAAWWRWKTEAGKMTVNADVLKML